MTKNKLAAKTAVAILTGTYYVTSTNIDDNITLYYDDMTVDVENLEKKGITSSCLYDENTDDPKYKALCMMSRLLSQVDNPQISIIDLETLYDCYKFWLSKKEEL